MSKDVQDIVRELITHAVESSVKSRNGSGGPLSGLRGVAAGAGMAALAPMAAKGVGKLVKGDGLGGLTSDVGDRIGAGIGEQVTGKIDSAGGPSGIVKDTLKSALPFGGGGGGGGGKASVAGVGKGRRMPVQQSVDIGVPIETAYNEWTQFEEWPSFMHRVTRVTQEDDCTVSFATKIWGKTKEFTAQIETQRPDERIKWSVTQGMIHTGVVTFHELGPNLTRVLLGLDVEPGGMMEKAARGMRHIKRAARADLHRFKALVEMAGQETGAWRGVIEDGELVEEHDESYDEGREYASLDDLAQGASAESSEEQPEDEVEEVDDAEEPEAEAEPVQDDEEEDEAPKAAPRRKPRTRGENGKSSPRSRSRTRTSAPRKSQKSSKR